MPLVRYSLLSWYAACLEILKFSKFGSSFERGCSCAIMCKSEPALFFGVSENGGIMTSFNEEESANLIVVGTVEEYARRHGKATSEVVDLFETKGLLDMLRSQYDVLHTMDLGEGADFVEDYLASKG